MIKQTVFVAIGAISFLIFSKKNKDIVEKLKEYEGFREYLYDDQAGNFTIGYGHKVDMNNEPLLRVTKEQAHNLLIDDINIARDAVIKSVQIPISSNQLLALTSLVFNIGVNAFKKSSLLEHLNLGHFLAAANEFPKWQYITVDGVKIMSPALAKRRQDEMAIFIS